MQTVNYDKNPSAEGAAARVSRASATPSISTDSFTSWPLGTKSHKIVATATTVATVGLPNADRPAAVAGQVWSLFARVRSVQARSVQVALVFYDTAGATLGTSLSTVTSAATFTAGEIQTMRVDGATAPASTASVDVQVSRNAGGGAAISDTVYVDMVALTQTATSQQFRDPDTDASVAWTGTAHASTQTWFDPAVTVTAFDDEFPCPRAQILFEDLWPTAATVDVLQLSTEGSVVVRDARGAPPTSQTYTVTDYELPPGVGVRYQARQYDASGVELGLSVTSEPVTVEWENEVVWVQDTLNPANSVRAYADTGFAKDVKRSRDRTLHRRGFDTMSLKGPIGLYENIPLPLSTESLPDAAKLEAVLAETTVLIRSMPVHNLPRCLHADVELVKRPVDVEFGGGWVLWPISGDQVSRSDMPVIVSVLSYTLFKTAFDTYTEAKAVYATYTEAKLDPPTEA